MTKEDIKYLKSIGLTPDDVEIYQDGGSTQEFAQSQVNPQEQIMQIIQMYAQLTQVKPEEIVKQLQSANPENQQKMIQQMVMQIQEYEKQNSESQNMSYGQEEMQEPQMKCGGKTKKKMYESGGLQNYFKSKSGNVEAEDDEHVLTPDGKSFELKGKTHAEGGIDLNLPSQSLIFSEKIKAPKEVIAKILNKEVGKLTKSEKKYSFADIANKYSTEKDFEKIKNVKDDYSKKAIELNITKKLPKLQEIFESQERYKFGLGIENDYISVINNKKNNNLPIAQNGLFWEGLPYYSKSPYSKLPNDYGNKLTKDQYINSWLEISKQSDLKNLREYQVANFKEGIQDFYNRGLIPYENYGETLGKKLKYSNIKDALAKDPYYGTTQYMNNRWGNRMINIDNSLPMDYLEDEFKNNKLEKYTSDTGQTYYTSLKNDNSGNPTIYLASPRNNNTNDSPIINSSTNNTQTNTNNENGNNQEKKPEIPNKYDQLKSTILDYNPIINANKKVTLNNLLGNVNEVNYPIMLRRPPLKSLNEGYDLAKMNNIALNKNYADSVYQTANSGLSEVYKQAINSKNYAENLKASYNNIPNTTKYFSDIQNSNRDVTFTNESNQYNYDMQALPKYEQQLDTVQKGLYQNRKENINTINKYNNFYADFKMRMNDQQMINDLIDNGDGTYTYTPNKKFIIKNQADMNFLKFLYTIPESQRSQMIEAYKLTQEK